MNSLQKTLAILLCGALCIGSMTSCSGKNGDELSENGETAETAEKTQVLTNVFRGTKAAVPEECTVNRNVTLYYSEERRSGTVRESSSRRCRSGWRNTRKLYIKI